MNEFVYQLDNGSLKSMSTTKRVLNFVSGKYETVRKTEDELKGWKTLITTDRIEPTIYQNLIEEYVETETTITHNFRIEEKTVEEKTLINMNFWNSNYFMIPISESVMYYAPHTTIMNNEVYNLLQDDLPTLMMGMTAQQITYLDVYSTPDYTQEFTKEYIESLKVRISDITEMTMIIGYMASLTYANREVPTVL